MSMLLKNSAFLHIPRTGGTWVRNVLTDAALPTKEYATIPHKSYGTEGHQETWHNVPMFSGRFREIEHVFCFVRNPLTWYPSYFRLKNRVDGGSWNGFNPFDHRCAHIDFYIFIEKVIQEYPKGYLSWMYEFYTDYATSVGTQEHLSDGLRLALQVAEEDWEAVDYDTPPAHVSSNRLETLYGKGQIEQIIELEKGIFERYDYPTDISLYSHLASDEAGEEAAYRD